MQDSAFQFIVRCQRCGRAKNQHRAFSLECPIGKRTLRGYTKFSPDRFAGPGMPLGSSEMVVSTPIVVVAKAPAAMSARVAGRTSESVRGAAVFRSGHQPDDIGAPSAQH